MKTESIERGVHHCWSIPSWCGISHGTKSGFLNPYITLTGETHHIYINYCLKTPSFLNECTTIFIAILNCKNNLVCIMMSSTFPFFSSKYWRNLNWRFWTLVYFRISYFGVVFDFAFQTIIYFKKLVNFYTAWKRLNFSVKFPTHTISKVGNFFVTVLSKCVWRICTSTKLNTKVQPFSSSIEVDQIFEIN